MDHIPYRDSKLTRLLQESLGGNYKTSLVVTCSPHSSQLQETLSSLKFAMRAKKIKNRVKINIKNSPDQFMQIIKQLKQELKEKNEVISQLLNGKTPIQRKELSKNSFSPSTRGNSRIKKKSVMLREINQKFVTHPMKRNKSADRIGVHVVDQTQLQKQMETNVDQVFLTISKPDEENSPKVLELSEENSQLTFRIKELTKQIETLAEDKQTLEDKLLKAEVALVEEKKRALEIQNKLHQVEVELQKAKHYKSKDFLLREAEHTQLQVVQAQITALSSALEDSENECYKLLREKRERNEAAAVEMCSLTLLDYIKQETTLESCGAKWISGLHSAGLQEINGFITPQDIFTKKNQTEIAIERKKIAASCRYAEILGESVKDSIKPETMVFLLRTQIIDAGIVNHNLKRVLYELSRLWKFNFLVWKLNTERATTNIKGVIGGVLQKTVDSLESLLVRSTEQRHSLKQKLENLEYDVLQLKRQSEPRRSGGFLFGSFIGSRPRIRRPLFSGRRANGRQGPSELQLRPIAPASSPVKRRILSSQNLDTSKAIEFDEELKIIELPEEEEFKLKTDKTEVSKEMTLFHSHLQTSNNILQELKDRPEFQYLESSLLEAQTELAWHKTLTELLMEELAKTRDKEKSVKSLLAEVKASAEQAVSDENLTWQKFTEGLKANYEKELCRKQNEISSLHELLAQWMVKYMDLEKQRSQHLHPKSLTAIFNETLRLSTPSVLLASQAI